MRLVPLSLMASLLAGAAVAAAPRPARAQSEPPLGWHVEGGYATQAIFDPGMHVFADSSWLPGVEARVSRDVLPESRFHVAPEIAFATFSNGRGLDSGISSTIYLQRLEAGVRVGYSVDRRGILSAYARGGVAGLGARAQIRDPWHSRNRDAAGLGGFAAAGIVLDAGPLGSTSHLAFALEAGHTVTTPLRFGSWGALNVNAAAVSATMMLSF